MKRIAKVSLLLIVLAGAGTVIFLGCGSPGSEYRGAAPDAMQHSSPGAMAYQPPGANVRNQ